MTRSQAEADVVRSHQAASKKAALNLTLPKPVGFNGGSTEKGFEKATVVPVFQNLGELVVTSLPTTKDTPKDKTEAWKTWNKTCGATCGHSCGGTCDCSYNCTAVSPCPY